MEKKDRLKFLDTMLDLANYADACIPDLEQSETVRRKLGELCLMMVDGHAGEDGTVSELRKELGRIEGQLNTLASDYDADKANLAELKRKLAKWSELPLDEWTDFHKEWKRLVQEHRDWCSETTEGITENRKDVCEWQKELAETVNTKIKILNERHASIDERLDNLEAALTSEIEQLKSKVSELQQRIGQ